MQHGGDEETHGAREALRGREGRVDVQRVCHGMLDATYEVDHIVPLHKGGEDHVDNCQALHRTCHAEKTQREEIERLHNLQMTACSERRRPPLECTRCKNIVAPYFLHDCRKIT